MNLFDDIKKSFNNEFFAKVENCGGGTNSVARTGDAVTMQPITDPAGQVLGYTNGQTVYDSNGNTLGTYAELTALMGNSNRTVAGVTLAATVNPAFTTPVVTQPATPLQPYINNVGAGAQATVRSGIFTNAMILNSTMPKFFINQMRFVNALLNQNWASYNTAPPFIAIFDASGLTTNIAPPSQVVRVEALAGGPTTVAWVVTAAVRDLLNGQGQVTLFSQDSSDQVTYTLGNQVTTFVVLPRKRGEVTEYALGPYVAGAFGPYTQLSGTTVITNTNPNNAADEWDPTQPFHVAGTNVEIRITPYYPDTAEASALASKALCCGTQQELQDLVIKNAIASLDKDKVRY